MQSVSQSASSPERYSNRLANVFGLLIALLTLTLPPIVISHYSANPIPPQPDRPSLQE